MFRAKLEIADIFGPHGPAWRRADAGHVSLTQLEVVSAMEASRTEALGGHVAGWARCGHRHVAYNSCKNRHCPKCRKPAARDWTAARAEDHLADPTVFAAWLAPLRKVEWAVYAKPPFGGLEAVPAYLGRLHPPGRERRHRHVRRKGYQIKNRDRRKVMRLATDEFIHRFLLHVLPDGFLRIRHFELLASNGRRRNIATIRNQLGARPVDRGALRLARAGACDRLALHEGRRRPAEHHGRDAAHALGDEPGGR